MIKAPKIGAYLDDEEKQMIEALEADDAVFVSHLTPKRKKEIEAMARAAMNPVREKITLRIAQQDLMRLKAISHERRHAVPNADWIDLA